MKNIAPALAVLVLLSSPVFSADKGNSGEMDHSGMPSNGMMMDMHEHMQKMHDQMAKIKAETDPDKRHELMQEHMQTMQDGMHRMNDGMGKGMAKSKPSKMGDMDMTKRMDMMERRMGMMSQMMSQMMEHESEAEKAPSHKHKKQ